MQAADEQRYIFRIDYYQLFSLPILFIHQVLPIFQSKVLAPQ